MNHGKRCFIVRKVAVLRNTQRRGIRRRRRKEGKQRKEKKKKGKKKIAFYLMFIDTEKEQQETNHGENDGAVSKGKQRCYHFMKMSSSGDYLYRFLYLWRDRQG